MPEQKDLSRRQFLKKVGGVAAATVIGVPKAEAAPPKTFRKYGEDIPYATPEMLAAAGVISETLDSLPKTESPGKFMPQVEKLTLNNEFIGYSVAVDTRMLVTDENSGDTIRVTFVDTNVGTPVAHQEIDHQIINSARVAKIPNQTPMDELDPVVIVYFVTPTAFDLINENVQTQLGLNVDRTLNVTNLETPLRANELWVEALNYKAQIREDGKGPYFTSETISEVKLLI